MSILDDIKDKPRLIELLWPYGTPDGGNALRIGGIGPEPGGSAVVFIDSGIVFDHNGGEVFDLVDAVMDRYGIDHRGAAAWLRSNGFLTSAGASQVARRLNPVPPKPVLQSPKASKDPNPIARVRYCTSLPGDLTLLDCYRMAAWVPVRGKKVLFRWRHSLGQSTGGTVRIARFGGTIAAGGDRRESQVRPWMTRQECLDAIQDAGLETAHPTFCMAGDDDCLADHDLLVLDMDYAQGLDPHGLGAALRDLVTGRLAKDGAAVFASTSGNGRHVVARLIPEDVLTGKRHYRALPTKAHAAGPQEKEKRTSTWHGLRIEIFPAGTRQHIVWQVDRKLAGPSDSEPLGRVGLDAFGMLVWKSMQSVLDRVDRDDAGKVESPAFTMEKPDKNPVRLKVEEPNDQNTGAPSHQSAVPEPAVLEDLP